MLTDKQRWQLLKNTLTTAMESNGKTTYDRSTVLQILFVMQSMETGNLPIPGKRL